MGVRVRVRVRVGKGALGGNSTAGALVGAGRGAGAAPHCSPHPHNCMTHETPLPYSPRTYIPTSYPPPAGTLVWVGGMGFTTHSARHVTLHQGAQRNTATPQLPSTQPIPTRSPLSSPCRWAPWPPCVALVSKHVLLPPCRSAPWLYCAVERWAWASTPSAACTSRLRGRHCEWEHRGEGGGGGGNEGGGGEGGGKGFFTVLTSSRGPKPWTFGVRHVHVGCDVPALHACGGGLVSTGVLRPTACRTACRTVLSYVPAVHARFPSPASLTHL